MLFQIEIVTLVDIESRGFCLFHYKQNMTHEVDDEKNTAETMICCTIESKGGRANA